MIDIDLLSANPCGFNKLVAVPGRDVICVLDRSTGGYNDSFIYVPPVKVIPVIHIAAHPDEFV
jgi:hypothetical protein